MNKQTLRQTPMFELINQSLSKEEQLFLLICKQSLRGKQVSQVDVDFENLFYLSNSQSLSAFIFDGIKHFDNIPDNLRKEQENKSFFTKVHAEKQIASLDEVKNAFDKRQLDYMIHKGAAIRTYYPKWQFRTMGDMDILVKDFSNAKDTMLSLDYKYDGGVHFTKAVLFEIHTNIGFKAWEYTTKIGENEYAFTPEGHFAYLIFHLAKHIKNYGCGFRQVLDLVVFVQNNTIDFEKVNQILCEYNLLKIKDTLYQIIFQIFDIDLPRQSVKQEDVDRLIKFMLLYGVFGFLRDGLTSSILRQRAIKSKTKFGYIFFTLFPSAKALSESYPILYKHKYLLPVIWIVRLTNYVFGRRIKITNIKENVKKANLEKEFLNNYGL